MDLLFRFLCIVVCITSVSGISSMVNAETLDRQYRSRSGLLSFAYPGNWRTETIDQTRTRYVENVLLGTSAQDANGVMYKVYDPYFVLEEAGYQENASAEVQFRNFVRSQPSEAGASFASYQDGKLFVAKSNSQGLPTIYLGRVDARGNLLVAGAAGNQAALNAKTQTLKEIFDSIRFANDPGYSTEPVEAVAAWYEALSQGDTDGMRDLTCSSLQALQEIIRSLGGRSGSGDLMEILAQTGRAHDYSKMRISMNGINGPVALVRISGFIQAAGEAPIPFYRHVGRTGNSNVLVVRQEAGEWKVCEPLHGQRQ